MKIILSIASLLALSLPSKAELFGPSAVNGAVIGGVAGAIIGNNSHGHHTGRGALIGAGAGLLVGAAIDSSRHNPGPYRPGPAYYHYPRHSYGPSYGAYYSYRPPVYYSPAPVVYSTYRPSYATRGLILGGITGAIIGHNNSHSRNGWQGAAIGAGAGLLLGAILDNASRPTVVERAPEVVYQEPEVSTQQQAKPQQNVTIINNYYNTPSTPMSQANSMFGR